MTSTTVLYRLVAFLAGVALVAVGCSDDDDSGPAAAFAERSEACFDDPELEPVVVDDIDRSDLAGTELTLVAYDSFVVSDGIFEAFEAETGIDVTVLTTADTGTMVSQAVLTAGDPVGDVMWGIDNTFLCRALEADVFVPYESPTLGSIDPSLQLDPHQRVTPVDVSDICVNYWIDELETDPPTALDDLSEPAYASEFVTENPETSAPGMGFLLATIARFGEGWEDYWSDLRANGVAITPGWSEAYYGEFIAGGGDRAIVTSYASSPVAELIFAEEPLEEPPTASLDESCFRSVEFAGILAGTDHPEAAALLVDFLVSPTFQEDIPLNMFVFPVNADAALPPEFASWATLVDDPLTIAPDVIEANRDGWTERWTEIVLR